MSHSHTFLHDSSCKYVIALTFVNLGGGGWGGSEQPVKMPIGLSCSNILVAIRVANFISHNFVIITIKGLHYPANSDGQSGRVVFYINETKEVK